MRLSPLKLANPLEHIRRQGSLAKAKHLKLEYRVEHRRPVVDKVKKELTKLTKNLFVVVRAEVEDALKFWEL